eukprot:TRINITY_DN5473_c0_g1_i3.p1 TRINITY_DN5473_c0_g1~~TRINITY_DN5473_c0_g1_i3.p1  ORF type:complete len:167 (-),score=28.48 TRINITY_DN5473_c0_g1_i3:49-549(-)
MHFWIGRHPVYKEYHELTPLEALRNLVVGPITEELVFRSAMLCLLRQTSLRESFLPLVFFTPMIFGFAHFHHVLAHIKSPPAELKRALFAALFQGAFTTVFGMYSVFLFLRTQSVFSAIAAHIFCNWLGFPRFDLISEHPHPKLLWALTIAGPLCFAVLLAQTPIL